MDFFDVMEARRSVRSYRSDPVPEASLNRILEAARMAPSASNRMPWRLVVVTEREALKAVGESGIYGKFLAHTPMAIVGLGDAKAAPKWHVVDTTIALEHVVLAATAEGLGTCWIGSFDEERVCQLLGVPESYRVIGIIAVGTEKRGLDIQGAAARLIRPRKRMDELVARERFEGGRE